MPEHRTSMYRGGREGGTQKTQDPRRKPKLPRLLSGVVRLPARYPLVRGMVSYGLLWPCSSLAQEYLEFGTPPKHADWSRASRYSIFGAFFMSPVFYSWMKISSPYFKRKTMATAVKRAFIEQVVYAPLALSYFLFGMSILEGQSYKECKEEVKKKFWPTYTNGALYWTTAQTINFRYISDNNRMVFLSFVSFVWTCYLAHVKSKI